MTSAQAGLKGMAFDLSKLTERSAIDAEKEERVAEELRLAAEATKARVFEEERLATEEEERRVADELRLVAEEKLARRKKGELQRS